MCNTLVGSANTSPTIGIPLCAAALKILRHAGETAQECALSLVDGGLKVAEWQLSIDLQIVEHTHQHLEYFFNLKMQRQKV